MPRVLLKITAVLIPLLAAAIGLAHAVFYDDGGMDDIRAFFRPSAGCARAVSCWEGIRPGLTRTRSAITLLSRHPWVSEVSATLRDFGGDGTISWTWSGSQPAWVNGMAAGVVRVEDGVVRQVEIGTVLSFSDVWLMFDRPDRGKMKSVLRVSGVPQVVHYAAYDKWGFWVRSEITCPLKPTPLWSARARIVWGDPPEVVLRDYDLPGWFYRQPKCLE